MNYRLTGNYGTFTIRKVVQAENYDEAFAETGICTDLIGLGWDVIDWPDGESWTIEVQGPSHGQWVEVDSDDEPMDLPPRTCWCGDEPGTIHDCSPL